MRSLLVLLPAAWGFTLSALPAFAGSTKAVDFNREVRPILADNCFQCHGFDAGKRQAKLRLDVPEGAYKKNEAGRAAVVKGDPQASHLLRRVVARTMPPPETGRKLTDEQITTLRRWVEQGARYDTHWAFSAPKRPTIPPLKGERDGARGWPRNPIDYFILARLQKEGLKTSPEADRVTLIRRVTLDLTGLPPTPAEVDAFVNDGQPGAYERVVERLLNSPHYGERMAVPWLDLARYADTHGYHIDSHRDMWRWREWVIDAFNHNLPFDQFTIQQLAGDLLPNATLEQKIATGFNRNHPINFEGGAIPEEYQVAYIADRIDTTATTWMGLTLRCAQCHDHKYDPFTMKDYYRFYAFFHNVPEQGLDGRAGNAVPLMKVASPEQQQQLESNIKRIAELEGVIKSRLTDCAPRVADWEKSAVADLAQATGIAGLNAHYALDEKQGNKAKDSATPSAGVKPAATATSAGVKPAATATSAGIKPAATETSAGIKPAATETSAGVKPAPTATSAGVKPAPTATSAGVKPAATVRGKPEWVDGKFEGALSFDGNTYVDLGNTLELERTDKFSYGAWVYPTSNEAKVVISRMDDAGNFRGWDLYLNGSGIYVHLVHQWEQNAIRVNTKTPVPLNQWSHVFVTYDGSSKAKGVKVHVNGKAVEVVITHDTLTETIKTPKPAHIGRRNPSATFKGMIDDVRVYDRDLSAVEVGQLVGLEAIRKILVIAPEQRTDEQKTTLTKFYLENHDDDYRAANAALTEVRFKHSELEKSIPNTMVMQELEKPRETHMLLRGQYDKKGDAVTACTPEALPALNNHENKTPTRQPNRLDLAQWLVDPAHPLTARVAVNRYWQQYFGVGLVKSVEDFGTQGERPSHPALLDWLATEFVRTGWEVKQMQRLIVTSATYRQSSRATPQLLARDPENRLLARAPRIRLTGEFIRDQALTVSGLLASKVGGPSVRPYHPAGLWEEMAYGGGFTAQTYVQDHGDALYRRSMYTFWKRTCPPASLQQFDAPEREFCIVRRSVTNTPLQALILMNDPTYVEASRKFAERIMAVATSPRARVVFAFRTAVARAPKEAEARVLVDIFNEQLARFQKDRAAAEKLLTVGESKSNEKLDAAELAAWTNVASVILNLDETITKS